MSSETENIAVNVTAKTKYGENVHVCGSFLQPEWDLAQSLLLSTDKDQYPLWSGTIPWTKDAAFEYKYLMKDKVGRLHWEHIKGNRTFDPAKASSRTISDTYGSLESQKKTHAPHLDPSFDSPRNSPAGNFSPGPISSPYASPFPGLNMDMARLSPSPARSKSAPKASGEKYSEDEFVRAIVAANNDSKSWRQKLEFVRSLFSEDPRFASDGPSLVYLAIYLHFLTAGEIKCEEDGRHYRPNHHANSARQIDDSLTRISQESPELNFVIRRIYPLLPSYASSFTQSVPLTRIRDIAHRGDLPRDLKLEIKHQLQNKLHRCAGPEDLIKSQEILDRITAYGAQYSPGFVHEYQIFHAELKEFFNARGLEDRLHELSSKGELEGEGNGLKDSFLHAKNSNADRLDVLRKLTVLRQHICAKINKAMAETEGGETVQRLRLADIKLEEFAFVVASEAINAIERDHEISWHRSLDALGILATNVALSGVNTPECVALASEFFSFLPVANSLNDPSNVQLLRVKATVERGRRLAEEYTQQVVDLFMPRVALLGRRIGINDHAIRVFCEGLVRSHLLFQLSKLLSDVLKKVRGTLKLPPWDALVTGVAIGKLMNFDDMNQVESFLSRDTSNEPLVAILKRAEGDEEIPRRVAGVVLAHELPHLSHLGVRARQEGIVFAAIDDGDYLKQLVAGVGSNGSIVKLEVKPDARQCSLTKSSADQMKKSSSKTAAQTAAQAPIKVPEAKLATKPAALTLDQAEMNTSGTKAFNAGKLHNMATESSGLAKFETPKGMVVPYGLMQLALAASAEGSATLEAYNGLCEKADTCALDKVPELALELQKKIRDAKVPAPVLKALCSGFGSDARLMVRSSANCEDLESISGAGLYDSLANVANQEDALAKAIVEVWASLWTKRAALSRRNANIPHSSAHMAVLVQEMLTAEYSFVMMTTHPISKDPTEIYIELALGMGETLASGAVRGSPYRLSCSKPSADLPSTVKTVALASFSDKLVPSSSAWVGGEGGYYANNDAAGLVQQVVDYSKERLSTDDQYRVSLGQKIAAIGAFVEKAMGGSPQDIEGAVFDNRIYLVQTRPQIFS